MNIVVNDGTGIPHSVKAAAHHLIAFCICQLGYGLGVSFCGPTLMAHGKKKKKKETTKSSKE